MSKHALSRADKRTASRTLRRAKARSRTTTLASASAVGLVGLLTVGFVLPGLSPIAIAPSEASNTAAVTHKTVALTELPTQTLKVSGDIPAPLVVRDTYTVTEKVPTPEEVKLTTKELAAVHGIRLEEDFVNNTKAAIQWPFPVGVHVGDRFGPRSCAGCSANHRGIDLNPGDGAEIQAIADGVVVASKESDTGLGVYVIVEHVIDGETVASVYGHMQHGTRRVAVGDAVTVGTILGNTGSTGMSTGPHLHFEIRVGGEDGVQIDPLPWLNANAGRMTR
jgi:murein DD-endopeptidase MepM/ murein hydrolase activator NlpD